jgi:hypothetical protein
VKGRKTPEPSVSDSRFEDTIDRDRRRQVIIGGVAGNLGASGTAGSQNKSKSLQNACFYSFNGLYSTLPDVAGQGD